MADIVSPEKRSQMMAGIKGKNTIFEKRVRCALHRLKFRYIPNDPRLPGKPDIVFPKYRAVLFVHGCFFHGHECHIFKWPKENAEFWHKKITGNQRRDMIVFQKLRDAGWRVGVVWECSLKGKYKAKFEDVVDECRKWLLSDERTIQIH